MIDAAVYLAWSSARGSGDLPAQLPAGRRDPGEVVAILSRAQERYRSAIFAPPPVAALGAPLCGVLGEIWREDRASSWAALPIEAFGDLHERHGARIHRKLTGVYYTPAHVVSYVVASSFGSLLRELSDAEMAELRVLDPACGCGTFLLGAYRKLLAWHAAARNVSALGVAARLHILARHIHGIDLDREALAIAELSLLFEARYGDPLATESVDDDPAPSASMATLRSHLVRGNALVSTDFTPARASDVGELRPLDVERAFPEVFARGGFDLVLGNPPYVSYGGRQAAPLAPELRSYFAQRYRATGWNTAHSLFMERAIITLGKRVVAFIVPDQVAHLAGYASLRALLLDHAHLEEVRYWGEDVFSGVTTPSLTFLLNKHRGADEGTVIVDVDGTREVRTIAPGAPWTRGRSALLLQKLRQRAVSVRAYLADCGVRTTDAKAQVVPITEAAAEDLPVLEGKQIGRYRCEAPRVAIRRQQAKPVYMRKRAQYERAVFLIRQTAAYPVVGPRLHATYFRNSLHALYAPEGGLDVHYLVALLNSKLMRFAYAATVQEAEQRVFPQVKLGALGQLPIRDIDFSDAAQRQQHDALVGCVGTMLAMQQAQAREPSVHTRAAIDELDQRIDALVYATYGLDDGEIRAVEHAVAALRPPP